MSIRTSPRKNGKAIKRVIVWFHSYHIFSADLQFVIALLHMQTLSFITLAVKC